MKHMIWAIVIMLMANSCATYKNYSRQDDIEVNGIFGEDISPYDTVTIASIPWRDFFRDSMLQALIDTGLNRNSDLKTASLRVAQAEATLSAARLAYLPGISLRPQGSVSRFSGDKAIETYSLALSAEWEIDLAGKVTNEKRSAYASFRQSQYSRQAILAQLIATIANSYYNLLAFDEQLSISRKSLESWDETIRTLETKKRVGDANEASVAQAKASKLEIENSILSLSQQTKAMENSLCLLLGWTPRHINRSELKMQVLPEVLSVGIPLQLLENRPDVRQAEYALQAAFYSTNVARSAFYPSLTLSGTIGWTNNSGTAIVNPGNWILNALGSLTQPLFNKGRNVANLKIAKLQQEEALVAFRQKLLQAGSEVNEALTQWQNAGHRLIVSGERITALEEAVRSTRSLMMHSGNASYLEVLTEQQTLLTAQLTEAQEMFDKIQGMIKLYHALGGGI